MPRTDALNLYGQPARGGKPFFERCDEIDRVIAEGESTMATPIGRLAVALGKEAVGLSAEHVVDLAIDLLRLVPPRDSAPTACGPPKPRPATTPVTDAAEGHPTVTSAEAKPAATNQPPPPAE